MAHKAELMLPRHGQQPEFTIVDMLKAMWHRRWLILCATVVSAALAWGIAMLQPKQFEASVLIAPVGQSGTSSTLGSMLRHFGGLASLAGLTATRGLHSAIEIATLKSNELTEQYIRKNDLLPILFPKKWNKALHRWKSGEAVPTLWDGSQYFSHEVRDLQSERKTGLVTVKIKWTNPKLAADWANGLVNLANTTLRQRAIDRANREIAYLKDKAKVTHNIELKNAIYTLMLHALQNAMIAQGEQEYAFRVVDPAVPPEKPSFPRAVLWTLAGLVLGFSMSAAYSLMEFSWRSQ